jgi:hypothetical protein
MAVREEVDFFRIKTGPVLWGQVSDWQDGYLMIGNEVLQMFLSKNYHQWKL